MCQANSRKESQFWENETIMRFLLIHLALIMMSISSVSALSPTFVSTSIGEIAVYQRLVPGTTPVIFLHGVYFDHRLWDPVVAEITNRTVITVDMPLHGQSKAIQANWTLDDCAEMLIRLLDELGHESVYAIGHSWGSMTILRAAAAHPDRFAGLGLCNMPYEASSGTTKMKFRLQHSLLFLRDFYTKQVGNAMFAESSRNQNPALLPYLSESMGLLSGKDIRQTDLSVIIRADDAKTRLLSLTMPVLTLSGEEDYVPIPPEGIDHTLVPGGHVSPLEQPEAVKELVGRILDR